MLLSEAWEKYQTDKKIEGYSALTLKTYCFQYNLLLRFFGDIDMGEFTTEKLKSYLIEAAKLKELKLGKRILKFLSELEIEHLREACHNTMENALFEFIYSTGCRIGEVEKLNIKKPTL
jgi:integrase/recombinase XerD